MSEIKIEGLDELLNKLSQVGNRVDGTIDTTLIEAGNNVKKEMQNLVVVSNINHKHIKDDIQTTNIKGEGTEKYVEIGPGKETNWRAKFLEFGTKKMSAKPFIEPAHLNTKHENMKLIKKRIMEALKT